MKVNFVNSYQKYLLVTIISLLLFACGGGGGGNSSATPSAAKISTANEEDLGTAATEGAKQALDGSNASAFRGSSRVRAVLDTLNESMVQKKSNRIAYAPVNLSNICTGGGSATIDTNTNGSSVIAYSACDVGGAIADGVVNITTSTSGTVTTTNLQYTDFTITIGSDVTTIDMSATCIIDSSSFDTSCTYSSDVTGIDGRTYSVSGSTISGNSSSGYSVSATITDPDHGTLSITTTIPILFDCTNGQPSSGEIQFSDSDGVLVTVTYNDCNSFTISYSGTSEIYSW